MATARLPEPPGRVKDPLFLRLRWNLSGDLNEIEVEDGLDENGKEKRSPFLSHALAEESIADPPLSFARVFSMDVSDVVFHHFPDEYKYEGFEIEKEEGSPITFRDVVTGVHDHLNQPEYRQLLRGLKRDVRPNTKPYPPSPDLSPNPDIYVKRVIGNTMDDRAALNVTTWALGEYGIESVEEFCSRMRTNRLPL